MQKDRALHPASSDRERFVLSGVRGSFGGGGCVVRSEADFVIKLER